MGNNLFTIIPYKDQLLKLEGATQAKAFYRHYCIDLITGERTELTIELWLLSLEELLMSETESNLRIIHLFYELGPLLLSLEESDEETLLAIDISYSIQKQCSGQAFSAIHLDLVSQPIFSNYKKAFDLGYQELLKGNCYQFNLTFPYVYKFSENLKAEDFIFTLWKERKNRGAYASATYIPYFDKLFLSNSPECLFQYDKGVLGTMPIKGTMPLAEGKDWKQLWRILCQDKKNQAELYMICDLLRNDLSSIELPLAHVVKKKSPLLVPGLLHQCSKIVVPLSEKVTLGSVIKKMFPGGSVTGAPKKRAVAILKGLESRQRNFYCGSTLLLHKNLKAASINIRSSEIDFLKCELRYQAGGGVTLLSKPQEEFEEMTYKHNSFIGKLNP